MFLLYIIMHIKRILFFLLIKIWMIFSIKYLHMKTIILLVCIFMECVIYERQLVPEPYNSTHLVHSGVPNTPLGMRRWRRNI